MHETTFACPSRHACAQAIVEQDPVFTNDDNMFMSRPERYRHGLRKARRFTALKEELKLRCAPPLPPSSPRSSAVESCAWVGPACAETIAVRPLQLKRGATCGVSHDLMPKAGFFY